MPRWGLLASLPALQYAVYTPEQIEQARKNLRHELHHIGAEGDLIEEFVDRLMEDVMADTDNQHDIADWTETTTPLESWSTTEGENRGNAIRSEFLSPEFQIEDWWCSFHLEPLVQGPSA